MSSPLLDSKECVLTPLGCTTPKDHYLKSLASVNSCLTISSNKNMSKKNRFPL